MAAGESRAKGYGQYCPISRALDVLGERWTLMIVRDLLVGTTRFNDLARGLPGLSRSLLSKRLKQLETANLVEHIGQEYFLTEGGLELQPIVFGFGAWGARWTFGEPDEEELDPEILVWWMHRRLDTEGFPGRRNVFHIRFTDHSRQFWIVVEAGDASVCIADPGFDVAVTTVSDLATLHNVWLGRLPIQHAIRSGRLQFIGPAALVRRMPTVFRLSPMAPLVTAAANR
ncbi:MAG: winged helix-turn-helix transcriptional regulator [Acidimicrobiales bacterium]